MIKKQSETRQEAFQAWWLVIRDPLLTVTGLGIALVETFYQGTDRPYIIALAVAMMGIPWSIRADQWLKLPQRDPPQNSQQTSQQELEDERKNTVEL